MVFRTLILQFNMCTPGREDAEVKLYSKSRIQSLARPNHRGRAKKELGSGLPVSCKPQGGVGNISSINNCATRLRIALHDMSQTLDDEVFKSWERTASSVVAMPFR